MRVPVCVALIATLLVGCEGERSTPHASTSPAATAPATSGLVASTPDASTPESARVTGAIPGAPAGTLVFLVRDDANARDLLALADTVLDATQTDAEGRYALYAEGDASAWRLLVSAPGRALARTQLGEAPELAPEARLELSLGADEDLAMALVLDAAGRVLPLPAADLVSDAGGRLSVGRLPAGTWEVLVASPDLSRCAQVDVTLGTGEQRSLELRLAEDHALTQRILRIVRGPEVDVLTEGGH